MARACIYCGDIYELGHRDFNLLDSSGPFFCSASCIIKYMNKNKSDFVGEHPRAKGVGQTIMQPAFDVWSKQLKMGFRVGYEMAVAEWFAKYRVKFMYEQLTYFFDNGTTSYTPDFFLPDFGYFLEVKGIWRNNSRAKMRKFRDECDIPVITATWFIHKTFDYNGKSQGVMRVHG